MRTLAALVFLLSCTGFAEDKAVTVCVGTPASDSRLMINTKYEQNQLVRQINQRGQSKKAKVKMSAVALEGDEARGAQAANCDYLVTSEYEAVGGSFLPQVGTAPGIGSRDAARRSAQLIYKVTDLQSGRTVAEGLIPLSQTGGDESDAVRAIRDLGDRVFNEVTRARGRLRAD